MQQDLAVSGYAPLIVDVGKQAAEELFGQTAAIVSVPLFQAGESGLYQVDAYVVCSTAGAGILSSILTWDDGVIAQSAPMTPDVVLVGLGNYSCGTNLLWVKEGKLVSYEVTIAGLGGGAQFDLFIRARKL